MQQATFEFYDELPEDIQWSDEEIETLRLGMPKDAIRMLFDDRTELAIREDVMGWISDAGLDDGGHMRPFSFLACCRSVELDPDALRNAVKFRLKQAVKHRRITVDTVAPSKHRHAGKRPGNALALPNKIDLALFQGLL